MRPRLALWAGVGALIFLLALGSAYGFRSRIEKNSALGTLYFKYRFWKPNSISVDSNNDGKIDATAFLREDAEDFSDVFRKYIEDRDFDGHFETTAFYRDGVLEIVEVDRNNDGIPEEVHEGEEAKKFFLQFVPRD